jgi:hypothetical protein
MGRLIGWIALFVCAPACADAETFATELSAIPHLAWAVAVAIAIVGGVTRILMQLSKKPPAIEMRPAPIAYAMWMSLLGGLVFFFAGLGIGANPPFLAILVFAGALAGTAGLDAIKDRVLKGVSASKEGG